MKLSKRLMAIAKLISKHSNHGYLADIGSDHGYLPCWLIEHDISDYAYACEIADGPLQACQATVQLCHMEDKISVRKGDGLAPIVLEKLDVVSICGMGGNLICDILEANLENTEVNTLVLQANINEVLVRQHLNQHGWKIIDEDIVEDMHHYYEIIVARKGEQHLGKKELYMGPFLLERKGETYLKKWLWQKEIHENILKGLDRTHPKYPGVKQEYDWILEEIYEN